MTGLLGVTGNVAGMMLALGVVLGGAGRDALRTAERPALPHGALAHLGTRGFRHDGEARGLAFSGDGKMLVGYTLSGVHVWDAATGRERHRLLVQAHSIGISPDGTTLAVCELASLDGAGAVSLWDLNTGKKIRTLPLPKSERFFPFTHHVCFSPDGKSFACNNNLGQAIVVELASGQVRAALGKRHSHFVFYNHAFSPDGKTFAIAVCPNSPKAVNPNLSVQLWEVATGKMIRTIHDLPNEEIVGTIAFSPDGKVMALGVENRILLADPTTGKKLGQLVPQGRDKVDTRPPLTPFVPSSLAFAPDGKKLVSSWWNGPKLLVWDVGAAKIVQAIESELWSEVAIAPDGKTVAANGQRTLHLWNLATGNKLFAHYQGHDSSVHSVAYSPDGKTLVSSASDRKVFWDTATWKQTRILPEGAHQVSFSPDGKQLAMAEGPMSTRVHLLDVVTGKAPITIGVPDVNETTSYSPDSRKLFSLDLTSWSHNNRHRWYYLRQWDTVTGNLDHLWEIPHECWLPSIASDGKKLFAATKDGNVSIYDVDAGRERLIPHQENEPVRYIAPSADGRVLACWTQALNSTVRLLEVVTGKEIHVLNGHRGWVGAVAWSPDGRLLASADQREQRQDYLDTVSVPVSLDAAYAQTVRLWDTATGKQLAKFDGLNEDVTALAFAPDGTSLATGLRDGSILIWDLAKFNPKFRPALKLNQEELNSRWTELAGDARMAHQAIGTMVAAPKQSVAFLHDRLAPVASPGAGKVRHWIADLDSDKFAVRQAATKDLEQAGSQVQAAIQLAMKGNVTLETRRRLEQILNKIYNVPGPEVVRTIRAIMVLERIGSPEAKAGLETLARGAPGAPQTEEARASLERLKPTSGTLVLRP